MQPRGVPPLATTQAGAGGQGAVGQRVGQFSTRASSVLDLSDHTADAELLQPCVDGVVEGLPMRRGGGGATPA